MTPLVHQRHDDGYDEKSDISRLLLGQEALLRCIMTFFFLCLDPLVSLSGRAAYRDAKDRLDGSAGFAPILSQGPSYNYTSQKKR
ncbi:hypothetical protein ASPZODRAFT_127439 [Penicilliopsis zonata CBS 506.65]|uniref:Uncharacterized protein n=1 Tax=Penicilliopsis zonata CBS 506.65 TaxID=1073090 RepID=A0A1L9SW91_9EURO|nr:hypothetical protein ASPZODRAFT_127439 [Penicilliopsis zonata CBS 506.65]OJJ51371.1 hypothetical protein ASPZODRAFT_127439 [Penicilliopsis zonata CBS 506.65]